MPEAVRELEELRDKYTQMHRLYHMVCRELNRYMGLLDVAEKDILALIDERDRAYAQMEDFSDPSR